MSIEKVPAMSPLFGLRVVDKDDLYPRGFTADELNAAYAELAKTAHDYDMLMESATMEEVSEYFNPGTDKVEPGFIFEAIVIDKFSRTEHRMNAVVRVLNKHLSGSEINALPAVVEEPKKSGAFAYVTVQLPFSDGQVVSVIFHSPEGDKKKIAATDTIIAFRWLLNKRDITHLVAPEEGSEVSLETIGKRVTQLVEKNSARFERTQKEAAAERKALEEARENVGKAEVKQQELMDAIASLNDKAITADAKLANAQAELERQKTYNAELQAKIDGLRRSAEHDEEGQGGTDTGASTGGDNEIDTDEGSAVEHYKPAKAIITAVELPFAPGPNDIIMNAQRPLVEHETATGNSLYGTHYALINTDKPDYRELVSANVKQDAKIVIGVDRKTLAKIGYASLPAKHQTAARSALTQGGKKADSMMQMLFSKVPANIDYAEAKRLVEAARQVDPLPTEDKGMKAVNEFIPEFERNAMGGGPVQKAAKMFRDTPPLGGNRRPAGRWRQGSPALLWRKQRLVYQRA
ncbi:defense against restriction DarA-related protein [Mailhella sp.]|uniref:defense against restriction DarA-related protein n=1 Tax=Mailhella sp. TaxID=1981029 RepID=UPI00406312B5